MFDDFSDFTGISADLNGDGRVDMAELEDNYEIYRQISGSSFGTKSSGGGKSVAALL